MDGAAIIAIGLLAVVIMLGPSPVKEIFWHPAVIGLLVGLPSSLLGYLIYRRSRELDEAAEQAGIATAQRESIGQVVDGLNRIITALQEDNAFLRTEVSVGREDVKACLRKVSDLRRRVDELEMDLRRAKKGHGREEGN